MNSKTLHGTIGLYRGICIIKFDESSAAVLALVLNMGITRWADVTTREDLGTAKADSRAGSNKVGWNGFTVIASAPMIVCYQVRSYLFIRIIQSKQSTA